jgi:hypothetical protein
MGGSSKLECLNLDLATVARSKCFVTYPHAGQGINFFRLDPSMVGRFRISLIAATPA